MLDSTLLQGFSDLIQIRECSAATSKVRSLAIFCFPLSPPIMSLLDSTSGQRLVEVAAIMENAFGDN
jgi:hypothetical protein